MGRFSAFALAASLATMTGAGAAAAAAEETQFALVPLKRGVRLSQPHAAVEKSLRSGLAKLGAVADSSDTRSALRRLRLRDVGSAPSEVLATLAAELDVDGLVAATLHDLREKPVPDLAISVRLYSATGELVWSQFRGASGLDRRKMLGLGVVSSVEALAPSLVGSLLAEMPALGWTGAQRNDRVVELGGWRGRAALVPLTSHAGEDALAVAEAATEALRAVLQESGFQSAAPACILQSLRRAGVSVWGELSGEARRSIGVDCGVRFLLTGSVEEWRVRGAGSEPEPEIGISLRLLDAATGRILWMGSREKSGWDGGGLFGLRRTHSRGALLAEVSSQLVDQLAHAGIEDLFAANEIKVDTQE